MKREWLGFTDEGLAAKLAYYKALADKTTCADRRHRYRNRIISINAEIEHRKAMREPQAAPQRKWLIDI